MKYLLKPLAVGGTIAFSFVLLFLYTKLAGPLPLTINSTVTNKTDVFTVTGEGKVVVKPDIAYVTVGIDQNGATVKQAQSLVNDTMKKIVADLKALGIDVDKDVQTQAYNVNPNIDWSSSRQRITGYHVSTSLKVKIRDIDKINDVIDAATAGGANQVSNITMDVENKDALLETARKEAVAEAKQKAQQAAQVAGFSLGRIINYNESSGENIMRPMYAAGVSAKAAMDSAVPSTQIQTGSQEVTLTVSLSYQIN
jgi:uncharacterized protein YggE